MPRRLVATPVVTLTLLLGLLGLVGSAAGCVGSTSPELRVLGVHEQLRHDIVFVQVTNPARHTMRLTKLEYRFAADGGTVSAGEMSLAREVPAGATTVVEIPLVGSSEKPMTMSGKLTAELDKIVKTFAVSARIDPHN
jgi:LEA14-like dessication related protein